MPQHLEQFCDLFPILTYNGRDKQDQSVTYGGYLPKLLSIKNLCCTSLKEFKEKDYPGVAPLLCAGITTYSPLRHWKVGKGTKVGVVGIGGLGHMAIKLAHAMGAHVVVFTTSANKIADAKKLGADEVVISKNPDEMKKHAKSLDLFMDTVAAAHNLEHYLEMLKRDGTLCLVGAPEHPPPIAFCKQFNFRTPQNWRLFDRRHKSNSEMLDFCAKHHLLADIEMIPIGKKLMRPTKRMQKRRQVSLCDRHRRFKNVTQ